jgi:branched-chain amino acid transport system substrate-binding protein
MIRAWLAAAFALVLAQVATGVAAARADDIKSVRIGYVISMSGPNAPGAAITQLPNYRMWVKEVNADGGILLKALGRRVPIEVIEYDDQSRADEMLRKVERLISEDKVDFILPPWGTGLNITVAPVLHDAGYPHLAVTAATNDAPRYAKLWPNSFWLLGTLGDGAQALIQVLDGARAAGKIGTRVAMVNVADQFGIEFAGVVRRALRRAKYDVVYDRAYPVESQDMRPILTEAAQADPDAFLAFSYPPDTMRLVEQARAQNFNPKIFYTAVGTAYPPFKERFGADAEGVMGTGGWNADSAESRSYLKRHLAETGREPDRWASPVTYAALQMLQQSIERVGKIDRAAVIDELRSGTFETVLGTVKLENNIRRDVWWVGQWQNGEFYGVAPTTLPGARAPEIPKPAWHAP